MLGFLPFIFSLGQCDQHTTFLEDYVFFSNPYLKTLAPSNLILFSVKDPKQESMKNSYVLYTSFIRSLVVVARCFINFNVESRIILVKTYASSERISIDYTTDCCQSKLFSGWLAGRKQIFIFWPCWSVRGQTFE